jgi:hypothetical protein
MTSASNVSDYNLLIITYVAFPVLLILAFYSRAEQLIYAVPALAPVITHFIHHGPEFLTGNLFTWVLLFPCLIAISPEIKDIWKLLAIAIIGFPLFSYIFQVVTFGSYNPGAWGFSGYIYVFYGIIVVITIFRTIGTFSNLLINHTYGPEEIERLKDLRVSDVKKFWLDNLIRFGLIVLGGTILYSVLLTVALSPDIILISGGYLAIGVVYHFIGVFYGLAITVLFLLISGQIKEMRHPKAKYWYVFGYLAIAFMTISQWRALL